MLLQGRRRGQVGGFLAVVFLAVLITSPAAGQDAPLTAERILLETPDPARFGAHLRYLTEEPHLAGSPRNMELADYVRDGSANTASKTSTSTTRLPSTAPASPPPRRSWCP
jgi:hypothetical protein